MFQWDFLTNWFVSDVLLLVFKLKEKLHVWIVDAFMSIEMLFQSFCPQLLALALLKIPLMDWKWATVYIDMVKKSLETIGNKTEDSVNHMNSALSYWVKNESMASVGRTL